jgi:hypothetical protein
MSPGSTTLALDSAPPTSRLATLPEGEPSLTLGWEAIRWAESVLVQPNGPRARQPFRLTRDQMRFLLWWYALDNEGRWLFNHGARRLAKGSGKSPFAAVLALIEFCAPVRIERKDSRLPGGFAGRSVDMPWVQIAATAESQTANTMRMVRAFAPKHSAVVAEYDLDPGKTKYYKLPEGTLEVITSSATAAEGAEASFVVGDETEHWVTSNGGPDLMATLADNLAKSGARLLETANSWKPGIGSVAEATWDDWVAQEEGRLRGDSKILYDARMAPPDTNMADPVSLRSALEFVYADCDWKRDDGSPVGKLDVRPIMQRIWRKSAKPDDSKRKYLNWPTAPEDAWTTKEAWNACEDTTQVVEDGEEIVIFFDGSKSRDATALVGCRVSDGHVFTIGIWEPDPSHDNRDVVPVAQVDATVEQVFERWQVLAFFADVKEWEGFAKVTWPTRYAEKLVIMAVPSGKDPQAIAWDMRSHIYDFTMAAELAEAEIREKAFTHDGDARLTRHVGNMRRHPNRWGVSVSKETPDSPLKIDGGVCMIGARMLRRVLLNSPQWQKRLRKQRSAGRGRVVVLS